MPIEMHAFTSGSPISSLVHLDTNLYTEIENAYMQTRKGVKTDTPILPEWDGKFFQLYCKNNGWFFAYKPIRGGIKIYHAKHQTEIKDAKGIAQDATFNPKQNLSMMTTPTWEFDMDAYDGFARVKNSSGKYNYANLNGELILKDEYGNPVWFDNLGKFYEVQYDHKLHATGMINGHVAYITNDGKWKETNIPYSKYNLTNTTMLEHRISHIITTTIHKYLLENCINLQNKKSSNYCQIVYSCLK